jgi:hypothetical protein
VCNARDHEDVSAVRAAGRRSIEQLPRLMGYIIHLRVETGSIPAARAVAIKLLEELHKTVSEIDAVSTTVSEEERQNDRHPVVCAVRLAGLDRCLRPYGHPDEHSPRWPTK